MILILEGAFAMLRSSRTSEKIIAGGGGTHECVPASYGWCDMACSFCAIPISLPFATRSVASAGRHRPARTLD